MPQVGGRGAQVAAEPVGGELRDPFERTGLTEEMIRTGDDLERTVDL